MHPGETDRIRRATSEEVNYQIDAKAERNVEWYKGSSQQEIRQRIAELDAEWDIERILTLNASTLTLVGLALGIKRDRRWLVLPVGVMAFLFQHSVQGWCPPLPLFRRMGVRTRGEIDQEKFALTQLLQ